MRKKIAFLPIVFLFFTGILQAQYNPFLAGEAGFFAGPVSFQGDYGDAENWESTANNIGFNVGIAYFLDLSWIPCPQCNRNSVLMDYLNLRAELSYTQVSKFKHYGQYVAPDRTSLFAQQLRGMYGSVSIVNAGVDVIYYFLGRKYTYYNRDRISPHSGIGVQFNHFSSKVKSSLGPMGVSTTTPEKYMDAYRNTSDYTGSFVAYLGCRYKISRTENLTLDVGMQRFFSDWVEGLNPDYRIYKENKHHDFLVFMRFGYVYEFD